MNNPVYLLKIHSENECVSGYQNYVDIVLPMILYSLLLYLSISKHFLSPLVPHPLHCHFIEHITKIRHVSIFYF